MTRNANKILVTGGGGFIGYAIAKRLVEKGYTVATLNRNVYPKLIQLGIENMQGDIRNKNYVVNATKGIDLVFHVAAKIGYWGPEKDYHETNVTGTQNLLSASKQNGVQKFIYTSTPSVIGYNRDVRNGNQDIPYPNSFLSPYSKTKAEAEQLVLNYNQDQLATIALRPHLVFGPGDTHLIPLIIQRAIEGKLPMIGKKDIKVDFTYIDNVVEAHLCVLKALENSSSACAGKAYFISNNEPVALWSWVNNILMDLGYPKIHNSIKGSIAYTYAHMLEIIWKILPLKGDPTLTRFLVNALSKDHWYNMEPASKDLGYHPKISMQVATEMTTNWLKKSKLLSIHNN